MTKLPPINRNLDHPDPLARAENRGSWVEWRRTWRRRRDLAAAARVGTPLVAAHKVNAADNRKTLARDATAFRAKAREMLKLGYWIDSANRQCPVTVSAIGAALGWAKSTTHDRWKNPGFLALIDADIVDQLSER